MAKEELPPTDTLVLEGFQRHELDASCCFYSGRLPNELRFSPAQFEEAWCLHPASYQEIMMHGRLVATPRWQQAFGRDYHYTGQVNRALPIPALLQPLLVWAQSIHSRLNGLLLNWYNGELGHYIGKHRDSTVDLCPEAPIVTISFGEERIFRLRPYRGSDMVDFRATDGAVFVMPFRTNLAWTHEVPKATRYRWRRISVTFRAFLDG